MPKYLYEKVQAGVVRRRAVDGPEVPVMTADSAVHTHPLIALRETVVLMDPREVRRPPDPVTHSSPRTVGFGTKLSRMR